MKYKTIVLASDHAGFDVKEYVKNDLINKGYKVVDVGAASKVPEDDYPEYMIKAGMSVASDASMSTCAIIFGASGQGEAIVANRFPGVRAIVWYGGNEEIITLSRQHNDANVLSIGAKFVDGKTAVLVVDKWLNTPFSEEERHIRRIKAIDAIS